MEHAWEIWSMPTKFWSENMDERDHIEGYLTLAGRIILRRILKIPSLRARVGFIWLHNGACVELF
jgi:hypothetical protein